MGDLLREFEGETVVVHFGGSFQSINAYTFANLLIAFADTARAVSETIDPAQEIEILLEANGPGSFRARVRRLKKGYGGVLSRAVEALFWGGVANIIYDAAFKTDPKPPQITVNTTEVIIQYGNDKIIVPRAVYDAAQNAKKNPAVEHGIERTFQSLQADERIVEFGLTARIDDPQPLVRIPRTVFPSIVAHTHVLRETSTVRVRTEKARLVILKAWLNHAKRKWSFEWNGVPISAPIVDRDFLDRIERREYLIGAGDALDVEITFKQSFDPKLGVYVNDTNSFLITRVIQHVPRS
jgi:hypothetical protein